MLNRSIEIGGRTFAIETGRMAKQADGAVTVRYGDTVVLVTATADRKERVGIDFLPLTVDYRENTYAAGKFPGGFFKREGRPNEKETLTSRLIDRPIRPLFPKGWSCETQIVALVLSADLANDPDIMAVTGASTALHLSDIPFNTPVAAVRVGLVNGEYLINPTYQQLDESRLDLVVVGSATEVVMVEAGASEVSEKEVLEAIWFGQTHCRALVALQDEMRAAIGKPKRAPKPKVLDEAQYREIETAWADRLYAALKMPVKIESYKAVAALQDEVVKSFPEDQPERRAMAASIFHDLHKKIARRELLQNRRRFDNRAPDQVRPVSAEVGVLPRTHGSALFTRGETQALVTCTLGTSEDAQTLELGLGVADALPFRLPFDVDDDAGESGVAHERNERRRIRPQRPEVIVGPRAHQGGCFVGLTRRVVQRRFQPLFDPEDPGVARVRGGLRGGGPHAQRSGNSSQQGCGDQRPRVHGWRDPNTQAGIRRSSKSRRRPIRGRASGGCRDRR